ncbi:MAG: YARHG domain-containing protein [Pseudomonadota bacterium]
MLKSLIAAAVIAVSTLTMTPTTAHAQSCYDLWFARNAIFNAYGFCFRTRLGRRVFNNADCFTRNPRLSRADARRVTRIRRIERRRGCRVNR